MKFEQYWVDLFFVVEWVRVPQNERHQAGFAISIMLWLKGLLFSDVSWVGVGSRVMRLEYQDLRIAVRGRLWLFLLWMKVVVVVKFRLGWIWMMLLLMLCWCWESFSRSKLCVHSFHKPYFSGFCFDFFIWIVSTEPIFKLFSKVKFDSERLYLIFEQLLNKLTKSLNNFLLLLLKFNILSINDQGKPEKRLFWLLLWY